MPNTPNGGDRFAPRSGLSVTELDGELVVVDESTSSLHYLDAAATGVWTLLTAGRTLADVVAALAGETDADDVRTGRDVRSVVAELSRRGLLVRAEQPQA